MNARLRKAVGSLAILAFLLFYMGAVAAIGVHLPALWYVQLLFYVVAGVGWGLPLIPLMKWMNRGS
jgi:hypothetical protein